MTQTDTPPPLSAVGRLEEALQCALTYLLFHEEEEFVTENVDYYREALGHDGEPREVSICSPVSSVTSQPFPSYPDPLGTLQV